MIALTDCMTLQYNIVDYNDKDIVRRYYNINHICILIFGCIFDLVLVVVATVAVDVVEKDLLQISVEFKLDFGA